MVRDRLFLSLLLCVVCSMVHAAVPAGYYNRAVGKKDAELKTAMHEIIEPHTHIDYGANGTWVVFRTSDVRSDGSIWDMYSDIVRYFPDRGSHSEMHIEHSVPKSWWGEQSTFIYEASFDLHHLVPADASTNMSKSNHVLGEVAAPTFDNGVSKIGKATVGSKSLSAFEPHDEYKGDFARMYMYVVTCYQDYEWKSDGVYMFNSESYPTLNTYARELLMKWHRNDPVSIKEINRNDAVYATQNNRNPYIDFPLLAEYLWGDSIGRVFDAHIEERPYLVAPIHGDMIDMGVVMCGSTITYDLYIEGANLSAPLTLAWRNRAGIELDTDCIAVDVAEAGTTVQLSYTNTLLSGSLRDTLVISGGGMLRDVEVPVTLQSTPSFITLPPVDVTSTTALLRWVAMPEAESYRVELREGAGEATDLFISAYVEGSGYNKAIALYNGTKRAIELTDYAIARQHNGVGEFTDYWKLPNVTLDAGATYILVNSLCDNSELRGYADKFVPSSEYSPLNFNGNDAVALYHNGLLTDVVGEYGVAENWGKDVTLYRSYMTLGPTIHYNKVQWVEAPQNDFALLRSHRVSGIVSTPIIVVDTIVTTTEMEVTDLFPNTTYTYSVTACVGNNHHATLYDCAFITANLPAPADVSAAHIYAESIEWQWTAVAEADGSEINCYRLAGVESTTDVEHFDCVGSKGTPLPEGWSGTASGNYTSAASTGSSAPSVALKSTGEYIETPYYEAPVSHMSFMYRFASKATGSSLLVEYYRAGVWQTLQRVEYENTSKAMLEYAFEPGDDVRAFRYTYSKVSGNMAIDDVSITYAALDTVYVAQEQYVSQTYATIAGLSAPCTYYFNVRSVLGNRYSDWSETIVATTDTTFTAVDNIDSLPIQYKMYDGQVQLNNLPLDCVISVYNLQGMLCSTLCTSATQCMLTLGQKGIYLIKIVNNENVFYQKLAWY